MAYNGSGVYTLPTNSFAQAVTGTTISSSGWNSTGADLATALTTAICKDGQSTTTQRIPFAAGASMGSQTITAVADGTAVTHAATVGQLQSGAAVALGTIAGTNTITAVATPALTAYAANKLFTFIPANTNTGATTININSVGARNIFWSGAACVGGEIRQNIPVTIFDDGTQFNIVGNGFTAPFVDTQTIVEGSADRTKKVRIEADGITTATERVWTARDADFQIGSATQAEQETATSLVVSVTPGVQQYHPSAVKQWVQFAVDGSIGASYNTASITDTGSGNWTVVIAADMSSGNYCAGANASPVFDGGSANYSTGVISKVAGSYVVRSERSDGSASDPETGPINAWAMGDQ